MNRKSNEFDLDRELEAANQLAVSRLVRILPDDEPSLEWRSQLNERLVAMPRKRKQFWSHPLRLAWVGSVATVIVVLFAMPQEPATDPEPIAVSESALVLEHALAVAASEIAGPGLNQYESLRRTSYEPVSDEWNELDLDTL